MNPTPPFGGRPGRGPAGFDGRRGGSRVRHGGVPAAVLALLAEQDMHGYQIIKELAERSGGVWRPGAGSIYPVLRALQEEGLIDSREEGSKRVFALTDAGRRAARTAGDPRPWQPRTEADAARVALRQASQSLFSALAQVEQAGSEASVAKATEIVTTARKSLYLLLAEEEA